MRTYAIRRSLLVGLFALSALWSLRLIADADQVDVRLWSNSEAKENVLVQSCDGFDLTTSYTIDRDNRLYTDSDGKAIYQYQQVSFSGAIGSATTGTWYDYDGHFTRIIDFDQRSTAISNLLFRFGVDTPGAFTVTSAHADFDLVNRPPAIVMALVPHVLQMDLCGLLGGSSVEREPATVMPGTELDPCDSIPSGRPC